MPLPGSEETSFTLDNLGRFICNTLDEATAGQHRDFDVIVVGGGTFGAIMASTLFLNDPTHSRRILVLESGPFTLPEHFQNLPYQGAGLPDLRVPWDSHPSHEYKGLHFTIGGRSLAWGGWSPEPLAAEMADWPKPAVDALRAGYFREAAEALGVADSNDFIYGNLHSALRLQLLNGYSQAGLAFPLAALPDHPAVRFFGARLGNAALAAVAGVGAPSTIGALPTPTDSDLRGILGLPATDTTTGTRMLSLAKLEAPLAVQSRTTEGFFPFNKFSSVPGLARAARLASAEVGGIGPAADARKRLMIVPKCTVLDLITETQADNWVRVTGVRVNSNGVQKEIFLAPRGPNGRQGAVVIALGTIESTRLAQNTFKISLAGRAAERMGQNLVAHLRSNLNIRVPRSSLQFLSPASLKTLQTSALFVKGKKNISGQDRFFHLQITASGLGHLGDNSEAEMFKKVPDIETIDTMLRADDSHVVITLRGIGEMAPHNADSFIRLSPSKMENGRPAAEVTLADIKGTSSTTPQSQIDRQTWNAMDELADQVALIFASGQPFELLTRQRQIVNLPANATVADLQSADSYSNRRDNLGTTHHDAGTMRMGLNPADSVTNDFGRIHDTTNCYVASPAIFPSLGSPNPMLGGTALARRTADLLAASVLPVSAQRAVDPGFTALFDGTTATFRKWKLAGRAGVPQGFQLIDGELLSVGNTTDIGLFYYAATEFADFHLRLQFRIFDASNHNSGVFVRFRDPFSVMTDEIRRRAEKEKEPIVDNLALSAVFSGFEIQIDDTAKGDSRKDFYGIPESEVFLNKNRTGAIYKIPAGDSIPHLGTTDTRAQQYVAGPPLRPGVWFQYDILVNGNRFEANLRDTESGQVQRTTVYDNLDRDRGVAPGMIGIQSYPNSQIAFRDIWIK